MSEISAADAAEVLGVSPRRVRALLKAGQLVGRQVAGRWILTSDQVERRQVATPPSGRPWSQASAWRVLAILAHAEEAKQDVSASTRSRARARAALLRDAPPREVARSWRSALRSRARTSDFYAHPSITTALLGDSRVVRGGISAASDHDADLMVTGGVEGYVRSGDLQQVVADYALRPESAVHANVRLHVVEKEEAAWLFHQPVAPVAVVAADLIERDSPRDRAAGVKLAGRA